MNEWEPISLENIRTYPLKNRASKVTVKEFGKTWTPGGSMKKWLESLPEILATRDLLDVSGCIVKAVKNKKMVILGMGAHPIKVGLNPVIIDLMERGIINAIAMNGAGTIHDSELAMAGHTSEDVDARLGEGIYGMAEETGKLLNEAIKEGAAENIGMGAAIGSMLLREDYEYNRSSLLARASEMNIPVTVHVAMGTDTIHYYPAADGAAIGKTSHTDFRIFAGLVSKIEDGVFINLGSAVIIPEVFLKSLTLARNLGFEVNNFTTLVMDFIKGYRPMTNVFNRPTKEGGQGFSLVGHHEIMFPLLAAAVIEGLNEKEI
ncbi:MAG: hypothetical protein PVG39_28295 [Desulfobacteraceae bacterium]|jgi:hypothetical protein